MAADLRLTLHYSAALFVYDLLRAFQLRGQFHFALACLKQIFSKLSLLS